MMLWRRSTLTSYDKALQLAAAVEGEEIVRQTVVET